LRGLKFQLKSVFIFCAEATNSNKPQNTTNKAPCRARGEFMSDKLDHLKMSQEKKAATKQNHQ
jgi:hypothetical protein